jgi:hypothetical protein
MLALSVIGGRGVLSVAAIDARLLYAALVTWCLSTVHPGLPGSRWRRSRRSSAARSWACACGGACCWCPPPAGGGAREGGGGFRRLRGAEVVSHTRVAIQYGNDLVLHTLVARVSTCFDVMKHPSTTSSPVLRDPRIAYSTSYRFAANHHHHHHRHHHHHPCEQVRCQGHGHGMYVSI